MKKLTIHTDGSCPVNPGYGGSFSVVVSNDIGIVTAMVGQTVGYTTNNRMEISAVLTAMEFAGDNDVEIFSDSQYVVNSFNSWVHGWERKDFNEVKNADLMREFLKYKKKKNITLSWVKGHNGDPFNEFADALCHVPIGRFEDDDLHLLAYKDNDDEWFDVIVDGIVDEMFFKAKKRRRK